jgi:hypothetical protein
MNFREWLTEAQSPTGNRNMAPPRLINIGGTRDWTYQTQQSPSDAPPLVQVATGLAGALGRQVDKERYRGGYGRPQTPTQFVDPSLYQKSVRDRDKKRENWYFRQNLEVDITNLQKDWKEKATCCRSKWQPEGILDKDKLERLQKDFFNSLFEMDDFYLNSDKKDTLKSLQRDGKINKNQVEKWVKEAGSGRYKSPLTIMYIKIRPPKDVLSLNAPAKEEN